MPTLDELRAVWRDPTLVTDQLLESPWFHIGVLRSGMADGDRLRLSLDVISDALASAENEDRT